ncbi:hypothetical protein K439DRAFT_1642371 [Ramaria rubella]|nr:hypothetical protein K439DRAFT_1642371 [Ramaria rubella]
MVCSAAGVNDVNERQSVPKHAHGVPETNSPHSSLSSTATHSPKPTPKQNLPPQLPTHRIPYRHKGNQKH